MEELYKHQSILLNNINDTFQRKAATQITWNERFICIKGLRGVGKTTMLLQHLKYRLKDLQKNLYISLDNPYFYNKSLIQLAEDFSLNGGEVLLVDEVHKLENWSRSIKHIFDTYPKLQLILSSSSALDILRGEADLSRRVQVYTMGGLSFREFLKYKHNINLKAVSLNTLTSNHIEIATDILKKIKPLPLFREYLLSGYYPFSKDISLDSFQARLHQTLDTTLNVDMAYINDFSPENTYKIKKLLGVIVESPPFSINISSIADKLGIGRNTVKSYLHAMEKAGILNFLSREGKGVSLLQKPDKVFLENTNMAYALKPNNEIGNIREAFALNQLKNAGYETHYPKTGDYYIPSEDTLIEIGGKTKTQKQIKGQANAYVFADDLEIGYLNKIPLYLLGMLY